MPDRGILVIFPTVTVSPQRNDERDDAALVNAITNIAEEFDLIPVLATSKLPRKVLLESYSTIMATAIKAKQAKKAGQNSLFD